MWPKGLSWEFVLFILRKNSRDETTGLTMPKIPLPLRILAALIGLIFVLAGGAKLAAQQMMLDQFAHFGYASWFMYLVGLGEVLLGAGLFIPRVMKLAALGLAPIMFGAVVTHALHDPLSAAIPAAALLMLLGYVAWRLNRLALAVGDPLQ
jgi:uncharacterized membrane protein YphA (DoxX/SURF4 family)